MIVLDTNVVSELMRSAPQPDVVRWVDRQDDLTLYLTTITLAEVRVGITARPEGRRRNALDDAFETRILPMFGSRVLAFDEPASSAYARVRADARARGRAIGNIDAMIAAIAQSRRFTVASRDVAPFEAAGVPVIDPFR